MAVPSGYPVATAPMPYLPSVIIRPETVAGVRTYQINLVLDIIFGAFALIIGTTAIAITAGDPSSMIGLGAVLGAASCGLVIVFVINFIVSLMSVLKMHHGAEEYGPEHARHARLGVMYKWAGTGLSTLATILVVYLVIFGFSSFFFVGGGVPPTAYVPLLVTVFWTGGVTCKGQMYRYMVRSLQPPETRRRSDLASLLIPTLGIVGIGVVGVVTVQLIVALQNPGSILPIEAARLTQILVGGVFLPPGLALVGYILFLSVYLRTSERLSRGLSQVHAAMGPPFGFYGMAPPLAYGNPYGVPPWTPPAPPPPAPATPAAATPAAVTCSQCGRESPSDAAFCVGCGAKLN